MRGLIVPDGVVYPHLLQAKVELLDELEIDPTIGDEDLSHEKLADDNIFEIMTCIEEGYTYSSTG